MRGAARVAVCEDSEVEGHGFNRAERPNAKAFFLSGCFTRARYSSFANYDSRFAVLGAPGTAPARWGATRDSDRVETHVTHRKQTIGCLSTRDTPRHDFAPCPRQISNAGETPAPLKPATASPRRESYRYSHSAPSKLLRRGALSGSHESRHLTCRETGWETGEKPSIMQLSRHRKVS